MKLVMIRGFRHAWSGSVSALGLGRQVERAGCFTAVLVTPAKLRLVSSFIKFEGTTEISLKTLRIYKCQTLVSGQRSSFLLVEHPVDHHHFSRGVDPHGIF